ncbi:hypothetical protein SCHPADRAFT_947476 [Schizopora paradoxa]|uniref:Uncharacterized protein n=1 Tax=Schizopora paradoxa TaxID=27342 RepID=A0A0H2R5I4_9AGAM|nr:hypothetical protein SCHPADRAFT_947476 [Schizopora paradoxa]
MSTNTVTALKLTTAISSSTLLPLAGRRSIPSTCVDEYDLRLYARKSGALPLSFCTVEGANVVRGASIRPYNVWEGLVMCSLWTWCSADVERRRRATWSENDDDGEAQHSRTHHARRTTAISSSRADDLYRRSIPFDDTSRARSSERSKFESYARPLAIRHVCVWVGAFGKDVAASWRRRRSTIKPTDIQHMKGGRGVARGMSIRTVDVLEATGTSMDGGLWKKNGGGRCVKDFVLHSSMQVSARERSSCALDTYRQRGGGACDERSEADAVKLEDGGDESSASFSRGSSRDVWPASLGDRGRRRGVGRRRDIEDVLDRIARTSGLHAARMSLTARALASFRSVLSTYGVSGIRLAGDELAMLGNTERRRKNEDEAASVVGIYKNNSNEDCCCLDLDEGRVGSGALETSYQRIESRLRDGGVVAMLASFRYEPLK